MSKSIKFDKTKVIQRGKSESMKFLIIVIFAIIISVSSAFAYSDNPLPESIKVSIHGYEINLNFSDGKVSGTILFEDQTINLDDAKIIERRSGFLIFDKQNDLKILAKLVGQEKYLVLVKINSDDVKTKFRFLTESITDKSESIANTSQRNLMAEYLQNQKQQPDIENMSFREQQDYLKQQKIDEILQKQKEIRDTNVNDYSSGQSIIDAFNEAQKTTGTALVVVEEKTTEPTVVEQYIPELIMRTSHDFTTYWKEIFNIEVMTYDSNINSNPDIYPFEGKLDGVDISVTLSLDNEQFATLSGITQYGQWKGEYFIKDNISIPGEYVVDVIASYLGKIVSNTSTMFVIGTTTGGNGSTPSVFATGTVTLLDVGAGDTVTINGLLYTAVAGAKANSTEFSVDENDTVDAADLADSINNDGRLGDLGDVSATSSLGVVTVTSDQIGTAGNAVTLAETGITITISGATFSGGVD
ncbi:MAG: hypothetical protein IIA83_00775 [Thaumarchaeota archaeon]|nr:hypothetical protein [Nitrososphaerota archaeon]